MLELHTFERIFKEHHTHCLAFATHYIGDPYEAEEVVQLVFSQLWEKRASIAILGSERSYLFSAIRNTAISQWRKQNVRSEKETSFGKMQDVEVHLSLQARELENKLEAALEKLPERCREVFVLSRKQQLKYAEIASVMNISVKTVENQMGKALKILHQELKEYLNLFL
ncbi:RNA polymerase sigma-70 factor [Chitinophaga sp. SYP-B3965]|uniref:RNA polymerase sigma-70 factor n=1 Tax=Chitinophaga sp. SYP-B3965 TaxID=2663120 RepID=UPI0012995309|nr:RNA polymerase sigma-70 factor [Chitinophaga sp. SYP-B3965]MRG48895.1 RNA polymerase sigma-70 factor [Chitinophaga sp. SYP-B3965]